VLFQVTRDLLFQREWPVRHVGFWRSQMQDVVLY
jgi:hypothetical protein